MLIKPELVKKINMYFHDEESRNFEKRHTTRIKEELDFYADFFKKNLVNKNPHPRVLDIGSGTGLVGQAMGSYNVRLVSTDISYNMLSVARKNVGSGIKKNIDFAICDAEKLPFCDGAFDIVTCNAAMHHFPSPAKFIAEAMRVLSRCGCMVVGFEANRRFWSNATLSIMYRIFSKLTKASKDHGHTSYADICLSVNERLVAEGVISSHINSVDMLRLVDIHSPNSGQKIDRDEGFDAVWLRDNYFKPYECTIYYHYSGLPKLIEFINRSVFAASAPKFSLIIKKK